MGGGGEAFADRYSENLCSRAVVVVVAAAVVGPTTGGKRGDASTPASAIYARSFRNDDDDDDGRRGKRAARWRSADVGEMLCPARWPSTKRLSRLVKPRYQNWIRNRDR